MGLILRALIFVLIFFFRFQSCHRAILSANMHKRGDKKAAREILQAQQGRRPDEFECFNEHVVLRNQSKPGRYLHATGFNVPSKFISHIFYNNSLFLSFLVFQKAREMVYSYRIALIFMLMSNISVSLVQLICNLLFLPPILTGFQVYSDIQARDI